MSERAKVSAKTPETNRGGLASQANKTNSSQSINSPIEQILLLQRSVGNRAVQGLLKSGVIQAKLTINQQNDVYEQEADRVAEQVMRMPELSKAQRKEVSEYKKSPSVQRVCTDCEEQLQRQPIREEEEKILQVGCQTPEFDLSRLNSVSPVVQAGLPTLPLQPSLNLRRQSEYGEGGAKGPSMMAVDPEVRKRCSVPPPVGLGCPVSWYCDDGKKVCEVIDCGTGACPSCPPGYENLVIRAWCAYSCAPSGSAFILIMRPFNIWIPICLD